ncbi:MAG: FMN-binding protein [Myxococcaceae bacterium]
MATLLLAAAAHGQVFKNKDEALHSAFPDADRFTAHDVLLTDELAERLQKLARAKVSERMVTFYVAQKHNQTLGYAVIHSHVVRTKRETFALSFEPDGRIRRLEVIVFLEPSEYLPPDRWLAQLEGKTAGDRVSLGSDINPISGATLSARGVTEQTRWLLQALKASVEKGYVPK